MSTLYCSTGVLQCEAKFLFQSEIAEAVADLGRGFDYFHSGLDHQLAGECLARSAVRRRFIGDAAVLALFIPAKPAHRDILRGEVLHGAQQHVVLGNLELSPQNLDGDQFVEWTIERAGAGHEGSSL